MQCLQWWTHQVHAQIHLVEQMPYVKNVMALAHVHVYRNIMAIRTLDADQNVYKIPNVIKPKLVSIINVWIHVRVFVHPMRVSSLDPLSSPSPNFSIQSRLHFIFCSFFQFVLFEIMHQIASVITVLPVIQRSLVVELKSVSFEWVEFIFWVHHFNESTIISAWKCCALIQSIRFIWPIES